MMAAAQAAAEAALREAAALENSGAIHSPGAQVNQSSVHADMAALNLEAMEGMTGLENPASEYGMQQHMLNDFLVHGNNGHPTGDLLHLLSQQQQQSENFLRDQMASARPPEHYMTIAHDGTILETTNTVTGFPPEALLMTSTYDTLYDEDLPGFLCVKSQFWDRQHPDVEVYIRRRSLDGDWVWLSSKVVSYVSQPIPGVTLMERVVEDEEEAARVNQIIRRTAILVQAVEAARLTDLKANQPPAPAEPIQPSPLSRETSEMESLLKTLEENGVLVAQDSEAIHQLLDGAMSGKSIGMDNPKENEGIDGQRKKGFDPFAMMESVRHGIRLDLGLTRLPPEEIKLVVLVLSGKLSVDDVAPLVLTSLESGYGLSTVLKQFKLGDRPSRRNPRHHASGSGPKQGITPRIRPPSVAVVNLSYSYIGNAGVEMLSEIIHTDGTGLRTLDVSFCGIDEKGFLSLARSFAKRKKKGIEPMKGLILSGNYLTTRGASELGLALAVSQDKDKKRISKRRVKSGGYETDSSDDDDDDFNDVSSKRPGRFGSTRRSNQNAGCEKDAGIQVLHLANTSMKAATVRRLFEGLGPHASIRELNLSSNGFGAAGASALARFLESSNKRSTVVPLPYLDRIDLANNAMGDDGATHLTKIISMRSKVHLIDLRLSSNSITAGGIETIMNKLLHHNLVSLSLDKNAIGDQGCQLVAASLPSMKAIARLNLNFNQIGSRGITSLMRSLIVCESMTFLGLSGNILKISGAMALAFTLAQHPRLEELHLDNCCLGQAAQCHIVAGIISNRWVPMKRLAGFAVGPPMVAIGALKPYAQTLSNEECFRIRKDEQMKNILQWMENHRASRKDGSALNQMIGTDPSEPKFLTPEFVSNINEVHGTPSQNAYYRLLEWLSSIPFDDDELTSLQKFFYDADGGDGDRGSDGYINLKLRGDLLAALESEVAEEIRDELPSLLPMFEGSVGIDLFKLDRGQHEDGWKIMTGDFDFQAENTKVREIENLQETEEVAFDGTRRGAKRPRVDTIKSEATEQQPQGEPASAAKDKKANRMKPRITMFSKFEQQLEQLKCAATEMIEQEDDPMHHEVILTQYAEASLSILRQLRYHCMNSGLDGWRQSGLKRKVLIVDDSRITRRLVSRAFENANFIVDTASNGAEGVEKMKSSIYDIAFMDIDMPVMNGFEATKKLREWEDVVRPGARQPICALTAAYVDDFERSELMKFKEAGLDVMESKPCNIPRLFKVVDDVSPMFSDLSISIQREKSESKLFP